MLRHIKRKISGIPIYFRIKYYCFLSEVPIPKKIKINHPVYTKGKGKISCGNECEIGIKNVKGYFDTISYLDLRSNHSLLYIGHNVKINNTFSVTSAGGKITIGDNTLIGNRVSIMDSDFHNINPNGRRLDNYPIGDVSIGENVWIGNNVTILKGSTIGNNSVVGANSLVKGDFPSNSIIAGIPAKIIREI